MLCLALSRTASALVAAGFEGRRARKTYIALVRGHMAEDSYIFDQALGADPADARGYRQMAGTPQHPVCLVESDCIKIFDKISRERTKRKRSWNNWSRTHPAYIRKCKCVIMRRWCRHSLRLSYKSVIAE